MKSTENTFGVLSLPYLVFEPDANDKNYQKDKILIYLHGVGDRGKRVRELEKGWGLSRHLKDEVYLPFKVVAPVCPGNKIWEPEAINEFIKQLENSTGYNGNKFILSGFSMGATGVFAFQSLYPGKAYALIPVAGRVSAFSEKNMALVPVFAIYGSHDERLIESKIQERFELINKLGGQAVLKILEGKGHYISVEAYTLREMIDWVIKI